VKNDPNAFPSLYARLVPNADGRGGFTVQCTATHRPLGSIWWWSVGMTVTWSYKAADGTASGDRSTKRGAVQALRDGANSQWSLMDQLEASVAETAQRPDHDTRDREAPRTAPASAPQVAAPVVRQTIDWNARPRTDINVADLTAKIAAVLNRRK